MLQFPSHDDLTLPCPLTYRSTTQVLIEKCPTSSCLQRDIRHSSIHLPSPLPFGEIYCAITRPPALTLTRPINLHLHSDLYFLPDGPQGNINKKAPLMLCKSSSDKRPAPNLKVSLFFWVWATQTVLALGFFFWGGGGPFGQSTYSRKCCKFSHNIPVPCGENM